MLMMMVRVDAANCCIVCMCVFDDDGANNLGLGECVCVLCLVV